MNLLTSCRCVGDLTVDTARKITKTAMCETVKHWVDPEVYINYRRDNDGTDPAGNYGSAFDRLVEIKKKYDPDNLFRSFKK